MPNFSQIRKVRGKKAFTYSKSMKFKVSESESDIMHILSM